MQSQQEQRPIVMRESQLWESEVQWTRETGQEKALVLQDANPSLILGTTTEGP